MKQKLLSKLLAIAMVLTLLPAGVFAADAKGTNVAQIGDQGYATLQAAVNAAKKKDEIKLLQDITENVTVPSTLYQVTIDLNGNRWSGGTDVDSDGKATIHKDKAALTNYGAHTYIKDSVGTGVITRDDTGVKTDAIPNTSYYVIDNIKGVLTIQGGTIYNDSDYTKANGEIDGSSVIRNGGVAGQKSTVLTIAGGHVYQDDFIAVKNDEYGTLWVTGGTVESKNSTAILNWKDATIKKTAQVNGVINTLTYENTKGETTIDGTATVNGKIAADKYDKSTTNAPEVLVKGGNLDIVWAIGDATVQVTGGTFTTQVPAAYYGDGYEQTEVSGGYTVSKKAIAQVGDKKYTTMDDAFHAAVASGETLTLLRDYTTASLQNSGSKSFTIDLNGHTWTYTGTNVNDAAFEINYSDVTLTVKNGTVVSGSMVGLIPSAVGGKIKYDNSGLVFEDVEATANGHSGIETNGNNTNDSVTLKNSTLNVPNGFGIYFPSSGTLTIDNSTINAKTMGVQVCAGSLNINDGSKITVTGDAVSKTENDGAIQDGAAISIVNRTGYKGLGKIEVTGGKFTAKEGNSAIKAYDWANKTESDFTADKGTVAVSGGTFTSDPSAYCATGKTGIVSGNVYTVGDIATNVEVAPAAPAASAATDGKTEQVATAMKSAATAIGSDNTTVEGLTAVGGTEASKVTTDDVTKAAEDLKAAGVTPSAEQTVTVYVQPYLDIKVTDAKIDSGNTTELTMEINPMIKKVASTATNAKDINLPTDEGTTNAKVLSTEKVTVTTPVTITIPLPTGLGSDTTKPIYIKHVKENGATFVYEATVTETSGTYYATFTNPNGFSTFTVTATNPAVAKIGSIGYTTLQAAVDAAKNGETVTVTGGTTPYSATMSGSSRTIKVENGTVADIDVTINGTKKTIVATKSETFTYTAPVYAPITKKDVKFDDVDVNAYYAPAVKWAVENKITAGKTDKLFAPDDTCTRGEMITFLWNAAGKPAAKNTTNPFTDVNVGAFYYDAVLWAVENGITSGTTDTTFSPDDTVNRAQVVAFLYNYANKPAAANSTFSDVAVDAYYAPAVGWAAAQKITSGTGNNTFSPENDCTRAQIVTFLYNDLAK